MPLLAANAWPLGWNFRLLPGVARSTVIRAGSIAGIESSLNCAAGYASSQVEGTRA